MTRPIRKRIAELSGDLADLVEPLQPEMLLVRADLEDGILRGVADRLARADVLLAELLDDVGAGGMLVAQNAGELRLRDQRVGEVLRKGRNRVWEIAPFERDRQAGKLPMAGLRVLALGDLARIGPDRLRLFDPLDARRMLSRRGLGGAAKAEPVHHRNFQRTGAPALHIGLPGRAGGGDVAERVGARIAELVGVLSAADPDGIHDQEHRARHRQRALLAMRS